MKNWHKHYEEGFRKLKELKALQDYKIESLQIDTGNVTEYFEINYSVMPMKEAEFITFAVKCTDWGDSYGTSDIV